MDATTLRGRIALRSERLQQISCELKAELFGIDPIIDRVIETVRAWYVLPELVQRPDIVCLWGLTGTGKTQLVRLLATKLGFQDRFVEVARNGIGPDAWRNFSAFLGKLDDAIAQQQLIVSDSRQRTVQGQQEWVDQRNKVKAFDTLSHRHQSLQARKEAKQEQRLTDEHAAKQFRDRDLEE